MHHIIMGIAFSNLQQTNPYIGNIFPKMYINNKLFLIHMMIHMRRYPKKIYINFTWLLCYFC